MVDKDTSYLTLDGWELESHPCCILTDSCNSTTEVQHRTFSTGVQFVERQALRHHSPMGSWMRVLTHEFCSKVAFSDPIMAAKISGKFSSLIS